MLTYNNTISVYNLHRHCKDALNTIGNGWRQSIDFFQTKHQIEPIKPSTNANEKTESIVPPNGRDNPCEMLLLASDEDDTNRFATELIVSLPQIETDDSDGILNIRLPFKRKQNFNFNSKTSAFVLLKYYVTVRKCYEFRKQTVERFELRFLKLMKEKFLPFLQRDDFYPGFGAILRITESLNHRAIVSRNIVDDVDDAFKQSTGNQTDSSAENSWNDVQANIVKNPQNGTSFFEKVVHIISLDGDDANESKSIEILFFLLVATVLSLAFIILCCCIIIKSRRKNKKANLLESKPDDKKSCFKSFFKRGKNVEKATEEGNVSDSRIGPRSSSILVGNDFDDTGTIEECDN